MDGTALRFSGVAPSEDQFRARRGNVKRSCMPHSPTGPGTGTTGVKDGHGQAIREQT